MMDGKSFKMVTPQNRDDKPIRFKRKTLEVVKDLFSRNYPNLMPNLTDDAKRVKHIVDKWVQDETEKLVTISHAALYDEMQKLKKQVKQKRGGKKT